MGAASGPGPTMQQWNGTAVNEAYQAQAGAKDTNSQLQNIATNGSQLANATLQGATNQNIANSTGIIASAKGINPAMAAREAGYNNGNIQQTSANDAAKLQASTQMGALGQIGSNQLQQEGYSLNQQLGQNNTIAGLTTSANAAGAATAGQVAAGIGTAAAALAADGGMASNGVAGPQVNAPQQDPNSFAPAANYISSLKSQSEPHSQAVKMMQGQGVSPQSLQSSFANGGKANKKIPAMVSPGEVYLKPGQAKQVAKGKVDPIKAGEKIPGKPKVPGNSYANDVVPKKLDAGGVVIPNSVMQSSDPAHNAYRFVQAVIAQNRAKGKK